MRNMWLMTYGKASFVCESRWSVPGLDVKSEYDFDFAFIFAPRTQERPKDGLDLVGYFCAGISPPPNITSI